MSPLRFQPEGLLSGLLQNGGRTGFDG